MVYSYGIQKMHSNRIYNSLLTSNKTLPKKIEYNNRNCDGLLIWMLLGVVTLLDLKIVVSSREGYFKLGNSGSNIHNDGPWNSHAEFLGGGLCVQIVRNFLLSAVLAVVAINFFG